MRTFHEKDLSHDQLKFETFKLFSFCLRLSITILESNKMDTQKDNIFFYDEYYTIKEDGFDSSLYEKKVLQSVMWNDVHTIEFRIT